MSKARHLGDLLDTDGDVVSGSLDNVPTPDLTSIHQAIATLGLHTAVSDNKAAYNLPNAFIDTFEDSTGVTTQTDVSNVSEYFGTISTGARVSNTLEGNAVRVADPKFGTYGMKTTSDGDYLKTGTLTGVTGMPTTGNWTVEFWFKYSDGPRYPGTDRLIGFGNGVSDSYNELSWGFNHSDDMNYYENSTNHTYTGHPTSDTDWHHYLAQGSGGGTVYHWYDGVYQYSYTNSSAQLTGHGAGEYAQLGGRTGSATEYALGVYDDFRLSNIHRHTNSVDFAVPTGSHTTDANTMLLFDMEDVGCTDKSLATANATGTLISDTQTAPAATTEVSGVILYKDNAGTATLGTHLKIYFTADNGSNWTEAASYGTAQTFSGTTKQVKLGKTTVTSGTQVALKAVWASQASTTMETQLHGWAVNY